MSFLLRFFLFRSFQLYTWNSSGTTCASVCELPCFTLLLQTSVWLMFWYILTLANQIQGGTFASGSHVIKYVVEYLIAVIKNYLSELYPACGSSALHGTVGTTGNAPKFQGIYISRCMYICM